MIETYKQVGIIDDPDLKEFQSLEIKIFYNRLIRKHEDLVPLLKELQDKMDKFKPSGLGSSDKDPTDFEKVLEYG